MHRILPAVLVVLVAGLAAAPAEAAGRTRCDRPDNTPGLKVEFGFSFSGGNAKRDSDTEEQIYKMELKKRGVDARSVRVAGDGCLEAFVQNPDGTWDTEYYDPRTYELVWD